MVKPDRADADAVQLAHSLLTREQLPECSTRLIATVAAENLSERMLSPARGEASWEASVREAAFALEASGRQSKAIALLESTGYESPELKGMLGGRLKRRWLADPDECEAAGERALALYTEALAQAERDGTHDQAFYNGINVAFMTLALKDDAQTARAVASTTLAHVDRHPSSGGTSGMWGEATRGEALLYLGQIAPALKAYRRALALEPDPRQQRSMAQQAVWAARLLDLPDTEERLVAMFRV
jgi:tetratricopeptide (TPR) repeat protein